MIEHCAVLDDTFSDTDRYPSLIEFEVRSLDVPDVTVGNQEVHIRLCVDEYFPRLKALGRLAVGGPQLVESTRSFKTSELIADV